MKKSECCCLCILLFCLFVFSSCSVEKDVEPSSSNDATATDQAMFPVPDSFDYPSWIPEIEVQRAYNYTLYLAATRGGYDCEYAAGYFAERKDLPDSQSYFSEDGTGFCLYSVFSGMQQREILVLGTNDFGAHWYAEPETIHVTTYLDAPIINGDVAYIHTTNGVNISESVIVLKTDGTEAKQISSQDLLRDSVESNVCVKISEINVNSDRTVTISFLLEDKRDVEADSSSITRIFDESLQATMGDAYK